MGKETEIDCSKDKRDNVETKQNKNKTENAHGRLMLAA